MISGQDLLDYIAKSVKVKYEVLSNFTQPRQIEITFSNDGDKAIPEDGWSIYMYNLCQIETANLEILVEHVVGGLFKLTPTGKFEKILPGRKLVIHFITDEPTISRSKIFPNWYVAKPGLKPAIIASTADESLSFVADFDDQAKWKKSKTDPSNPFSPEQRYDRCVVENLGKAPIPILPTPLEAKLDAKTKISLSEKRWVVLNANSSFENEAVMLSKYLNLDIVSNNPMGEDTGIIEFRSEEISNVYSSNESYKIVINPNGQSITLSSLSPAGMFYAVQSMISMLEDSDKSDVKTVPVGTVVDAPRFQYRGFHIDVSRNFVKPEEIMKLIRVMAAYKMNKLHFHLTDDEGWRLEIKDLPELTDVGAKRDHDLSCDGYAVKPTLGSGPYHNSSVNQYYTVEDYRNILQCAADHHIQVIPEVDMPGHSYAAVVAMSARYKYFMSKGDKESAEQYLLLDLDDKSMYSSDQKFSNNTMNPCVEGTKNFAAKIVQTLIDLHEPIQPLKIFHVGGDEVPVGAWDGSPACNDFLEDSKLDVHVFSEVENDEDDGISKMKTATLQEYFTGYVEEICREKKLQLAVWNDGIWDPAQKQKCDVPRLVHAWRISRRDERHNPNILANSGYQVVVSSATHTYFDHPYEPDPEECGLTWCVRMMDTKTVFGMKPYDMYACQSRDFSKIEHAKLERKSSILGIQSHVWGELIRSESKLEYMLFPRLLAIAERAWHASKWEESTDSVGLDKDWRDFANTLGFKELHRLDEMGVSFRIPPPGLKLTDEKVFVECGYPNLRFKYKEKGVETWIDGESPVSVQAFEKGRDYVFATCVGSRMSRLVTVMF